MQFHRNINRNKDGKILEGNEWVLCNWRWIPMKKIWMRLHKDFDPSCEFQRRDDFKEQIKTFYYILLNSFIRLRIRTNK